MKLIIQRKMLMSLMLVAAVGIGLINVADALAECDLKVTFTAPTGDALTGGQEITWTLKFENIGDSQCAANRVRLRRYTGKRATGYGVQIGGSGNLQALPALEPGETAELTFVERRSPNRRTYTYKISYSSAHNDTDNFNHHPTKTVTYQKGSPTQTGTAGTANSAKCDLKVEFIAPTGDVVTGSQELKWVLRFTNVGGSQCKANRIRLNRFTGRRASGYSSAVGGSGNLQKLPALDAGDSADLTFVEKKPPGKGKYTCKPRFSSPHNDANNSNHQPTKTVTFESGT